MPATLLDIGDQNLVFPDLLVLDASLVLELTPTSHPHHYLARDFLNRLQKSVRDEKVLPLLPRLALEECYFKICKDFLTGRAKSSGQKWHHYYKANPQSLIAIEPDLNKLYQILLAFPIHIVEPEDLSVFPAGSSKALSERMAELIIRFNILPKDATIISEAERLGVYSLATLDNDWERADGFTVIAPI